MKERTKNKIFITKQLKKLAVCCMAMSFGILIAGTNDTWADTAEDILFDKQDVLGTSDDYEEVVAIDASIREFVEDYCKGEGIEVPETIDYENALKVYVGADVLAMGNNNKEEIMVAFKDQPYVWLISAPSSAGNIEIDVARGLPLSEDAKEILTEEQQQDVIAKEGKWCVSSAGLSMIRPYKDMLMEVAKQMEGCSRIILAGGQSGFYPPVAIGFDETNAKYVSGLGRMYEGVDHVSLEQSFYEFDKLTAMIEPTEATDSSEIMWGGATNGGVNTTASSETSNNKIIIVVIALCCIVIIGVSCVLVRKKHQKNSL